MLGCFNCPHALSCLHQIGLHDKSVGSYSNFHHHRRRRRRCQSRISGGKGRCVTPVPWRHRTARLRRSAGGVPLSRWIDRATCCMVDRVDVSGHDSEIDATIDQPDCPRLLAGTWSARWATWLMMAQRRRAIMSFRWVKPVCDNRHTCRYWYTQTSGCR